MAPPTVCSALLGIQGIDWCCGTHRCLCELPSVFVLQRLFRYLFSFGRFFVFPLSGYITRFVAGASVSYPEFEGVL